MSEHPTIPPPQSESQSRMSVRGRLVAAWLFPVLAWAAATLYFGGALGKNCDDYSINMRDVVTDALPTPFDPWIHFPYFLRPLHTLILFGGMTLWPEADRGMHIAVALCHALACLGIWRLMREFTQTRLAPAAAVLVFMVLPWHGEVAFWYSTISTSIGLAVFCGVALLVIGFCRSDRIGWRGLGTLGAIFVLALLVPCFYEQSITPAAALPLIGFAGAPAGWPWVRRGVRAIVATSAAGLGAVLYVGLLVATAPKVARGGAMSFVTRERMPEKLDEVIRGVKYNLIGERAHDMMLGSVTLGRQVVATPKGLVIGSVLLAAATLWGVWAVRRGGVRVVSGGTGTGGPTRSSWLGAWLVPIGLIVFVFGFVPIFVINSQIVELRNLYVPLFGVAMVLAGVLDLAVGSVEAPCGSSGARAAIGMATRAGVALLAIASVGFGGTGLIGYQKLCRNRSERDLREMAQLRAYVPDPPPGTVFAPFRTRSKGAETNYRLFDRTRPGVFETAWSAPALLLRAYRRNDIGVTSSNPWAPLPLDKPGADGVRWRGGFGFSLPQDPDGGVRIPWNSMVPFVTDARPDARVRLISEIVIETPDHRDLEIRPPLVRQAMAAHPGMPTATYSMRMGEPEDRLDLIPLSFWDYADGSPVPFKPMWIWASGGEGGGPAKQRRCAWLAAYYQKFASMSISMPPLDRPERLLIRATMAEFDLDAARNEFAYVEELVVTMADAPEKELGVLRLDPREMKRKRRWVPLVVTLPPRPPPAGDRIVVTIRHAKDGVVRLALGNTTPVPVDAVRKAAILPVWVTPGYEEAIPLDGSGETGGK